MPATEPTQDKTGTVPGPTGDELKQALADANIQDQGTADANRQALLDAGVSPESKEQADQYSADQLARTENPNEPVVREANPKFGGELFW
jgi:hypothetical protein